MIIAAHCTKLTQAVPYVQIRLERTMAAVVYRTRYDLILLLHALANEFLLADRGEVCP